jgi:hypothetical protein
MNGFEVPLAAWRAHDEAEVVATDRSSVVTGSRARANHSGKPYHRGEPNFPVDD